MRRWRWYCDDTNAAAGQSKEADARARLQQSPHDDVTISMYLYRCTTIDVSLSMYLYRCTSIDVSLLMYLYRCISIDVSLSMYLY